MICFTFLTVLPTWFMGIDTYRGGAHSRAPSAGRMGSAAARWMRGLPRRGPGSQLGCLRASACLAAGLAGVNEGRLGSAAYNEGRMGSAACNEGCLGSAAYDEGRMGMMKLRWRYLAVR